MPADFTPFIDEYLEFTWPRLNGRPFAENDRIFTGKNDTPDDGCGPDTDAKTKRQKPKSAKEITDQLVAQLQKICAQVTARFLGARFKTPGFGPHAMRHIKATSIIKVTGSYENAALILWDAVETVRKNYSHVSRTEQLRKVNHDEYARMKAHSQTTAK